MTILAIDWGAKKIGLALGTTEDAVAFPYTTIHKNFVSCIGAIITEKKVGKIIIGWPIDPWGNATVATRSVDAFIKRIAEYAIPIEKQDERLTSKLAQRYMHTRDDHAIAAQILLQEYFDRISQHTI